jgi:hypothetical protein
MLMHTDRRAQHEHGSGGPRWLLMRISKHLVLSWEIWQVHLSHADATTAFLLQLRASRLQVVFQ